MGKNMKKMVAQQERLEREHEHGQTGEQGHAKGGKPFGNKEHGGNGQHMGKHEKEGKFKQEAQHGNGNGGQKIKKQY